MIEIEFTADETPHAVYRLYSEDALLYIGITWNLPGRMEGHADDKNWWPRVSRMTMVWYPSEADARKAEAEAIAAEKPLYNKQTPAVGTSAPPHGQRKGWHRGQLLGWRNPPPELAAWLREESARSGDTITALLAEAVTDLRAKRGDAAPPVT